MHIPANQRIIVPTDLWIGHIVVHDSLSRLVCLRLVIFWSALGFYALSLAPLRNCASPVCKCHLSRAMLLAMRPVALILALISPRKYSKAFLPVKEILPFVGFALGPRVLTPTMDHGITPGALEGAAICAYVHTCAIDLVRSPRALVLRAIRPEVDAHTFLVATLKLSTIPGAFAPCLYAIAFLVIHIPLTLVLCGVLVLVEPLSVRHILKPFTEVEISIRMGKHTFAMCFVVLPLTLVFCTLWPLHHTKAMPSGS
mmetsp:Transcript_43603/g.81939  ORF Transcript_43603/g.81939 Transcript_43603/m.81939 type:complete len:256 (-) Transcript_43603:130-897(-)